MSNNRPYDPILRSRHISVSATAKSLIIALAALSFMVSNVGCGGEVATAPPPFELA